MPQGRNKRLLTGIDDVIALFVQFANMDGFPPLPHVNEDFVRRKLKLWPKLDSGAITVANALLADGQAASSYFGGCPALPDRLAWPKAAHPNGGERSMAFLGQIACAELAGLQSAVVLSQRGYLYLFVSWDAEWGL